MAGDPENSNRPRRFSEEFLEAIVDTIPDMIWVKDADELRFVLFNKAGEELLGVNRDQLLGKSDYDLFPPRQADSFVARDREVLAAGVTVETPEEEILSPIKGVRVLHSKRCAIVENGRPRYILGISHDITERKAAARNQKQLEQQLQQAQKMEAIGLLAGSIAHDFNNLLTVIMTAGQTLLESLAPESTEREDAEDIIASAHRGAELTRQLLAFSSRQVMQTKVLDLNAVVANVERLLRRLIGGEVNLITLPGRDIGFVRADASQLEQVIVNLAINARDAMPEGGTLTLATANVVLDDAFARALGGVPGPYVMLSVTDTGHGMTREVKAHLFEPFFTTKKPGKGTGLGLSTVYGIVRQSGGCIMAESTRGRGTTFRIYLPQVLVTDGDQQQDGLPTATLYGSETILLIEDDGVLRELMLGVLQSYGYTVLAASDLDSAVSRAGMHRGPIHLLVTDVMPNPSAPTPLNQLISRRPDLRVLYVSGHKRGDAVDDALGPDVGLLQRPFTPVSLARAVRETLD